jgi:hypothetical protein
MSCAIFVQFFKCEIFIASCTLCMVEVNGVIMLTGGRPTGQQPSWTTGDGLGITERTTTIVNI